MLIIFRLFVLIVCLWYILIDKIHLNKRFTIDKQGIWIHYNWYDSEYNSGYFFRGRLIISFPKFIFPRGWWFYYDNYTVSSRLIRAYTKRGAIEKALKKYPDEFSRFNLDRLKGEYE